MREKAHFREANQIEEHMLNLSASVNSHRKSKYIKYATMRLLEKVRRSVVRASDLHIY